MRLVWLFLVGCGGSSGFNTGAAMIDAVPKVKSASALPFTGPDGAGNKVLGWKVEFYSNDKGTDCMGDGIEVLADLVIYTNQPASGAKYATINQGDISVVTTAPPTVSGTTAANVDANGFSMVSGLASITDAYLDHINGSISASGTDSGGNAKAINATFTAPACGTFKN